MSRFGATLLIVLALLLLPSCRKDCPKGPADSGGTGPEGPCTPLPLPGGGFGWNYLLPNYSIRLACFNPINGDEVILLASPHNTTGTAAYWKYRISDHTLTPLLTEGASGELGGMDWGSNGWVLVEVGTNIFKVKSNGDSLTQLTFTGGNNSPQWSPSCAAYGYTYTNGGPWVSVRTTVATGVSDTLHQVRIYQGSCWYTENIVVWADNTGVIQGDLLTDEATIIGPTPVPSDPDNAHYFGITTTGNAAVWSHISGLYSTDLANEAGTQLLLSTCDSRYFSGMDYSPQTEKLLCIRRVLTPQDFTTLLVADQLVQTNADGTGLQVLDVPFPE